MFASVAACPATAASCRVPTWGAASRVTRSTGTPA